MILKAPYDNLSQTTSKLPIISKIRKNKFPVILKFQDKTEEGYFDSLIDLKKKSLIFAGVTKQKDRARILKSKNIREIKDFFLAKKNTCFEKSFFDSFTHITVGKISRQTVKGVHLYNPDRVKIKTLIDMDKKTGVYSAKIEVLHPQTNQWIEKEDITNFFPDNWTVSKVFLECYIAYKNKKIIANKTYLSKTKSGIRVKFIIDETGNILTFYPLLETEN